LVLVTLTLTTRCFTTIERALAARSTVPTSRTIVGACVHEVVITCARAHRDGVNFGHNIAVKRGGALYVEYCTISSTMSNFTNNQVCCLV
jgi:predicted outer membrane repeat protein